MFTTTQLSKHVPKEGDIRKTTGFAWWPTRYTLASDGEERQLWLWFEYYEILERYRKLYSWTAGPRCFYEWYIMQWCIEDVRWISKDEYKQTRN